MLRIGFEAKRAFLNHTGLGNYSRQVIHALADNFPEHQYLAYTTKAPQNTRTAALFDLPSLRIVTPRFPFLKSAWRSKWVVPRLVKDKLDIYHGLSHEIPSGIERTNIRTVVTIHDLIFLRYPEYYKTIDRSIYRAKFSFACKHATHIVAVSEQTKRDIVHFFGTQEQKISVIYQACDPAFEASGTARDSEILERYQLQQPYILSVGTIEARKNLMLLMKALPFIDAAVKVVIVGKATDYAARLQEFIRENNVEHRVRFIGNVPFSDLPALYRKAALFVYVSRFEGFGIPLLEALHAEVPVIAATGSCLEESGGPHSRYVAPDDVQGLAQAANQILHDPQLAQQMREQGKRYAAAFSASNHARQLMDLYQHILG
jgi:glycosyltransferase involved in cell wall biosynthesis